ncbi:MAG: DUF962 domain-containing protein [Flavobacteriales bacterium]|nr:DUF962 domain-containing protein [Flavobacteriales bacterium]
MSSNITTVRKIDQLLAEYGESHQNKINKTIHWICVPIIFFSIFGLIRTIPVPSFMASIPYLSWASLLLILALLYYLILSFPLFLGFVLFGTAVVLGNEIIYSYGQLYLLIFSATVFILAWVGQFIGHNIEGKKPSFFKDLQFLLIGPAWLMHFIYKKLGIPY